jgi:hypothetical protein
MFGAYNISSGDSHASKGFWDAGSVRKNWFMGERDIVGGFFEGLTGRDVNRDPSSYVRDATLKRHAGHGAGQTVRLGMEGAYLGARAGASGAATLMGYGISGLPGVGSRWKTGRELRNASWSFTSPSFQPNRSNLIGPELMVGPHPQGTPLAGQQRRLSAAFEAHHGRPMTPADMRSVRSKYGLQVGSQHPGGAMRGFLYRTSGEHLKKGGANLLRHSLGSRLSWGLTSAFAITGSKDNLLDPYGGFAQNAAVLIGSEVGFHAGAAVGAAIGTAVAGPIGTAIGYGVGMIAGVIGGGAAVDAVWGLSEMGHKYGRNNAPFRARFHDSKEAATMRQRAMQSIHRSQMNARSAFGSEALALHS